MKMPKKFNTTWKILFKNKKKYNKCLLHFSHIEFEEKTIYIIDTDIINYIEV